MPITLIFCCMKKKRKKRHKERSKMGEPWLLRMKLEESTSKTFNMEKAVCNHGLFMMPPNCWLPSAKSLKRPLRLSDDSSVSVSIFHSSNHNSLFVHIFNPPSCSFSDTIALKRQVARMLKISKKDEEDTREFHKLHLEAKERGFGRIFRSPCIFEDAVKSLLLCNCTWERTLKMAQALCELQKEITERNPFKSVTKRGSKRKRGGLCIQPKREVVANFPSANELANLEEDFLKERCNLGYRAKYIIQFAREVKSGRLDLNKFENSSYEEIYAQLLTLKGFGPFVSANIFMCLGFYHKVPADTETIRHLQKVHKKEGCNKATIEQDVEDIYDKYAPFQTLAYWFELLNDYESKCGKLSELDGSLYHTVTGSFHFRNSKN